jgi:hypothetical protein
MLFALPWVGAIIAQALVISDRAAERNRMGVALNVLGLVVMAAAWLALMGFLGYRAYLAIP